VSSEDVGFQLTQKVTSWEISLSSAGGYTQGAYKVSIVMMHFCGVKLECTKGIRALKLHTFYGQGWNDEMHSSGSSLFFNGRV
jgi:hypothetical protein